MRENVGNRVGGEDPPAGGDRLRDDAEGGRGVGEPVGVARADEQGRRVLEPAPIREGKWKDPLRNGEGIQI